MYLNKKKNAYFCERINVMRLLKRTIQWTIGIICGLYLCLQVAVYIPVVQQWMGSVAASALQELWDWDISIGRIRFGLLNRVIIDDINLKDKNDSTMLHASRLAAKIDVLPLLEGRISIANAQLFGTQAHLYQAEQDGKPNFQFILDTFASKDTTSKPLNLHIGSVLLRRVEVKWDQHWKPEKEEGRLDPAHLHIKDISLTAHVRTIQNDSLNLALKRLSLNEKSGLCLKNLTFSLAAGKSGGALKDFKLQLPNTTLSIPNLSARWPGLPKKGDMDRWLEAMAWNGETSLLLTPSDFKSIVPKLCHADMPVTVEASMYGIEGCVTVPQLKIHNNGSLELNGRAFIQEFNKEPKYTIEINKLQINKKLQSFITKSLEGNERELSPVLSRLDTVSLSGRIDFNKHSQSANIKIASRTGNIGIAAKAQNWNRISGQIKSDRLKLNHLLADNGRHALEEVSFKVDINGQLHDKNNRLALKVGTTLPHLIISGREYNDLNLAANIGNNSIALDLSAEDMEGTLEAKLNWKKSDLHRLYGTIDLKDLQMERLGFGTRYADRLLSFCTELDLRGSNPDNIAGTIDINSFSLYDSKGGKDIVGPLGVSIETDIDNRRYRTLQLISTPLNIQAEGRFRFSTLARTITNSIHKKLPSLVAYRETASKADTISFSMNLQDTTLLRHLALQNIAIPERIYLSGNIAGHDSMTLNATIPHLYFNKEHLRNASITLKGTENVLTTRINAERRQKKEYVTVSAQANANEDRLRLIAGLDNRRKPRFCGEMDITANFSNTSTGKQDIKAWIAPNDIIISDTVWRIHPASISWDGQSASIRGFKINQSRNRGITIDGNISASEKDSLKIDLQDINVEYILDLVNFKSVLFQGLASGSAIGTGLLSSPKAMADITVSNFRFNKAPLGTLKAKATWGDSPNFLSLNATIEEEKSRHRSVINGGFNIGNKAIPDGLDLKINTEKFNLAFLNHFTEGILNDVKGRASGYCRIFGPFKGIDLEGDMQLDEIDFKLPMLGTSYAARMDSVHLRPGEISIEAMISDNLITPMAHPFAAYRNRTNDIPHTAKVLGRLMHNSFKNLRYEFNVEACKLLGYDFKEFGESSFYATCIVSGDVQVSGKPGRLNVDINAMPEAGTTFTYNVATPEVLTESKFITFNDATPSQLADSTGIALKTRSAGSSDNSMSSDLFINFNLQLTPAVKLRLLMDRKSGDMIELQGRGRIMANYHDKGRFNIYGTYNIQDGVYRLSLQDIIRRDFKFQPNGTIVFGGNPMKAGLNLKAVYSVSNVSLDDLTTSSLGFSKTRVDCILNLTGRPEQPAVAFDFDLPNASEDERQMVRSIVSTEEERNMQAIYLLGLGRFFNTNSEAGTQSEIAMNSIVSSTLSQQLNQFIANAVGNSKWSIGANLKTGDDGWRNMDVEGLLSGKLLDDRLLISGNFGYREKYYTQRSFISDVSVEYLLTSNGNISLKAYNQANDRYFVQSSLNTQGIGIQFKKDFNRFNDLFLWLIPKKNKQKD